MSKKNDQHECCGRGGARPGCGRKPGVKTKPVRLPHWLLDALQEQGDVQSSIIEACVKQYRLKQPSPIEGTND